MTIVLDESDRMYILGYTIFCEKLNADGEWQPNWDCRDELDWCDDEELEEYVIPRMQERCREWTVVQKEEVQGWEYVKTRSRIVWDEKVQEVISGWSRQVELPNAVLYWKQRCDFYRDLRFKNHISLKGKELPAYVEEELVYRKEQEAEEDARRERVAAYELEQLRKLQEKYAERMENGKEGACT